MTDLDTFITAIIDDRGPIKGVDLALEIVKHNRDCSERDVHIALQRMVKDEEIIEVEYTLPQMDYRVKSIFFPRDQAREGALIVRLTMPQMIDLICEIARRTSGVLYEGVEVSEDNVDALAEACTAEHVLQRSHNGLKGFVKIKLKVAAQNRGIPSDVEINHILTFETEDAEVMTRMLLPASALQEPVKPRPEPSASDIIAHQRNSAMKDYDFSDIIGLTIEAATPLVKDRGITVIRPRWADGSALIGTMDMRTDRLNVSTDDGVISSVGNIG